MGKEKSEARKKNIFSKTEIDIGSKKQILSRFVVNKTTLPYKPEIVCCLCYYAKSFKLKIKQLCYQTKYKRTVCIYAYLCKLFNEASHRIFDDIVRYGRVRIDAS